VGLRSAALVRSKVPSSKATVGWSSTAPSDEPAMAQKAREENAALEARIAALEAALAKKK